MVFMKGQGNGTLTVPSDSNFTGIDSIPIRRFTENVAPDLNGDGKGSEWIRLILGRVDDAKDGVVKSALLSFPPGPRPRQIPTIVIKMEPLAGGDDFSILHTDLLCHVFLQKLKARKI